MTATLELPARSEVPVAETWDLEVYFPTVESWEAALDETPALLEKAAEYRGHLGDGVETLKAALDDITAARLQMELVVTYAALRKDEDVSDSDRVSRYERAIGLAIEAGERLAFVQPELIELDPSLLDTYIASPQLAEYRHGLEDASRHRPHTRSFEIEELLAQEYDVARTAGDAFEKMNNADLDFGRVEDGDGNLVELSQGRFQLMMESRDRATRKRAFEQLSHTYVDFENTLAALHGGSVRGDAFRARVHRHESALDAALFSNALPKSVYLNLIGAVRDASPVIERYLALRREMLGLDQLAPFDLAVPMSPQPERMYTIPEAIDTVIDGLAQLGGDYQSDLRTLIDQRMVDWNETKGKRSGAYSWGAYGKRPVILMNWNGTTDHVFTFAHEAGHSMHTWYSNSSQPYATADYPIFNAEIASTVNEVLLTWSLLSQLTDDQAAERFAILNRFADAIWGTVFRQTMFADFEMQTHAAVESGRPLTAESLSAIYRDLLAIYTPGVEINGLVDHHWSRIPHFYHAFYVFQYATGMSAAVAIAQAIRDEGAPAANRYRTFLESGGSDYPLPMLQRAGIDLTTPAPVAGAIEEFDRTVAEMRRIWESGALSG